MKKTQFKDAVRNIRKRIVSYLSLCLVIMLGLGGLFTTSYMGAGLKEKAAGYYDDHNFKDYEMLSSVGLSSANVEKLKNTEGVAAAEGAIQTDGSLVSGSIKSKVTVVSLTKEVSAPDLIDGRFPTARDECMVAEDFAEVEGIKIGDKVKLSLSGLDMSSADLAGSSLSDDDSDDADKNEAKNTATKRPLYEKEFTVTGIGRHPDFLRRKSTNIVILPLSAYNEDVTRGLFTRVFIKINQPEKTSMFSEDYFKKTADIKTKLEAMTEELADDRAEEMKQEAYDQIDREWAKAEAELASAQREIDTGEADLYSRLAKSRKELNDAEKKLEEEVAAANKKLKNGEMTIAEYEKKIKDGWKELNKKKKELEDGKKELAKKKKELEDGKKELEEKKEEIRKAKEKFGGDDQINQIYDFAKEALKMIADLEKAIDEGDPAKIDQTIKEVGQFLTNHENFIRKVFNFIADQEVLDILNSVQKYVSVDFMTAINALNDIGADKFMSIAASMADGSVSYESIQSVIGTVKDLLNNIISLIDQLRDAEDKIAESEKKIKDGEKQIADAEKTIKDGEKQIADGEKTLKDGEKELKKKKAELNDGKKELKNKKAAAEKKISAGWDKYYAEKRKYESKLEEAKALLAENREKAEEKLAEAKAAVEELDCTWILLDRKANAGYVDINSNLKAIDMMGIVFGVMFMIITAVVCFSTLVIIIDEQKTLVGTAKAFGFTKGEVLLKYLIFGVSAAIIGSILSIIGGYLLSGVVQKLYAGSGMYPFGAAKSIITVGPTVIASVIIIVVTILASIIACTDILRSPASVLMKGAVLKKSDNKPKKAKKVSKKGSLYSRLIIRNMLEDKARVIVTIAIIAFSCLLMGVGISMKLAYDGMTNKQVNDVNKYDLKVTMSDEVSDDEEGGLIKVLESKGVSYLPATSETRLYRWDGRLDGLTLICADPEKLGEYYAITDPKTGQELSLPDDGVLIQKRMHESYKMNEGDILPILDNGLGEHDAVIKGVFTNYVGRTVVMSPKAYKSIFGDENDANCFYIKLNGGDANALKDDLLEVTTDLSFESKDAFKTKFESVAGLYDVLVYITTGIAILISFMILTNLSNIFLNRKKTELTVMRVNGFSVKQTKGYLSKESIVTTAAGIILGVLVGALVTPFVISLVQQPDLEFVKSFHVIAWVAAVALETLFAIVINTIVFRKVKDLNLRDIT